MEQNYGHTRFFPANDVAEKLTKLTKQKSLTTDDIQILKDLGFEIELKAAAVPDIAELLKKKKGK